MGNEYLVLVGYFKELEELILENLSINVLGYTDFHEYKTSCFQYLGHDVEFLSNRLSTSANGLFCIATDSPVVRSKLFSLYTANGMMGYNLISSRSYISPSANLGHGVIVQRFASVSTDASIGNGARLNYYANVTHNVIIGDCSVIAPGATVLGNAIIGACSYIGAQATVLPGVRIGSNVVVGANSNVTKDIPNDVIVFGNPARITRNLR